MSAVGNGVSPPPEAEQAVEDHLSVRTPTRWQRALAVVAMVGGVVTVLMALHISADVVSRNVGNGPLPGTLELTQYWSMVLIVMFGMGQAERMGEHIKAGVLVERLPRRSRQWAEIVVDAVGVATVSALTWFSLLAAVSSIRVQEVAVGAVAIPVWPTKTVVALGFALFAMQLTSSLARRVRTVGSESHE